MKWNEWTQVARDEKRWQDHQEKGLLKAEYVREYILRLWFEEELDVSIYELDFYPLVVGDNPGGVFLPLKDQDRFQHVTGDYALIWLNPETGTYDEQASILPPNVFGFSVRPTVRNSRAAMAVPG